MGVFRTAYKKILVTGGNGFIGSRVVRRLTGCGYSVRCLLRSTGRTDRIDGLDIERYYGDIQSMETLEAAMDGCDGVIHLACLSGWKDIQSGRMYDVAVYGTKNVLLAAWKCGNLRTVYVSSVAAVNGTDTPQLLNENSPFTLSGRKLYAYAFAKRDAEKLCREAASSGLPVITVNPGEVYGPGDRDLITAGNLADFANNNPVFVCSGGASIVHVDDVAAGIVAAFERGRPGERYILGGDNLTIRELAATTLSLLGQSKRIITLPNGPVRLITGIGTRLKIPLPFEPAVIPYALKYWFADSSKAKRELSVRFRPAGDVLKPALEWLKDNGYIKQQNHMTRRY